MEAAWAVCRSMFDLRFILGALLGWKVLAEILRPRDAADERQQLRQLQQQLLAARRAEGHAAALEAEAQQLQAQVAALQRQLREAATKVAAESEAVAAENARLVAQNEEALQQLRALAAALERQQEAAAKAGQRQHAAQQTEPEPAGELGPAAQPDRQEVEQLRRELREVRDQLSTVLKENTDLAERLLQVAFQPVEFAPSEGPTPSASPMRRNIPLCADEALQRRASAAAAPVAQLFGEAGKEAAGQEAAGQGAEAAAADPLLVTPFSSAAGAGQ